MGSNGRTARKLAGALALVCLFALSAGPASAAKKPLPRPVPVANDALAKGLKKGHLTPAVYTLERARSLFRLGAVRKEFGDVARPDPHAATLILRDLALRLRDLPPAERAQAQRLLARPSDGASDPEENGWDGDEAAESPLCGSVCIHWVDFGDDALNAPPPADADTNDIPDWVEDVVLPTFEEVWQEEIVQRGNPAPLSDDSSPNDGGRNEGDPDKVKLDVYLADVGAEGTFGLCTSDDPRLEGNLSPFYDISAYCVIDNDFTDFGSASTPQEFLEVTAAHEFRHASQFAEDFLEDWWLLEGEAMWMEGQVYPDILDRIRYLSRSPVRRPDKPLDHGVNSYEYGAWIFFRFLAEYFDDEAVIRELWAYADASRDHDGPGPDGEGPDQYSMQAAASATRDRGVAFNTAFATFAQWNGFPAHADHYEEGALYGLPHRAGTFKLDRRGTTGWQAPRLRHLASGYYTLLPRNTLGSGAKVRVAVDLPGLKYKPAAKILIFYKSGAFEVRPLVLDSDGDAARTVPFGRGVVSRVDLVLTNASARIVGSTLYDGRTSYSGGGAVFKDDLRTYRFKASIR